MINRNITETILEAMEFSPVVLLTGARQTGKSTLTKWIAKQRGMRYISLDDYTVVESIEKDPTGFLSGFKENLVIDEVQRIPKLLQAIKIEVDSNRTPGRYLLTGSANIFMIPKVSESLAGRMVIVNLFPFSYDELHQKKSNFIDDIFEPGYNWKSIYQADFNDHIKNIVIGGYPEAIKIEQEKYRELWFKSYITTILEKDIRDISKINGLYELPKLLSLIAGRSGSLLNHSSLSRESGIPMMTLKRYMTLLEGTFLINRMPAWYSNINKRLIKAAKVYISDTGLLSYLLGLSVDSNPTNSNYYGSLIETYVHQELLKIHSWSRKQPGLYYYRTTTGREVDFILENKAGQVIGIEVKSAASVKQKDFNGLIDLKNNLGDKFLKGIVLYSGKEIIPFSNDLMVSPINVIWEGIN